jgi:hypothetical protein
MAVTGKPSGTEEYLQNMMKNNPEQFKKVRYEQLRSRIEVYKPSWDKNGVIQYKTEHIVILQRKWGIQVEFIIAFDDLTKEGYRLMAVDEGKSGEIHLVDLLAG